MENKTLVIALTKVKFKLSDNFNNLGKNQKRFVRNALSVLGDIDYNRFFTEEKLREIADYDLWPKLTVWDADLGKEKYIEDPEFANQQFASVAIEALLFWMMHIINTDKTRSIEPFDIDIEDCESMKGINMLEY